MRTACVPVRRLPLMPSTGRRIAEGVPRRSSPGWKSRGYSVGTGGVEPCRSPRPPNTTRSRRQGDFARRRAVPRGDRTAMVRKGSPVRVRQRVLRNRATARCSFFRSGSDDHFRALPSEKGSSMAADRRCAVLFRLAAASRLESKVPTRYTPGRNHCPRSVVCSPRWGAGHVRELSFSDVRFFAFRYE